MTAASSPALELTHVSKRFGGVRALDDVSLRVGRGEVHGLLGENGSGKSTLIKILAGYHAPAPGAELRIGGEPVTLPVPAGGFRRFGLSFVHQELGLVQSLTVLENLWIGELSAMRQWRIPWRGLRRRALALFERFGLNIRMDDNVSSLSSTNRALLAIVRATEEMKLGTEERGGGLLVLDEPTVFLPRAGVERLFGLVRDIVGQGASALFVSHDLDEVREVTDHITVLRNGRVQGTVQTSATTEAKLVTLILGRSLATVEEGIGGDVDRRISVSINDLAGGLLESLSLQCHAGEIVGLTGLIGSGFADAVYLMYGAVHPTSGTLSLAGTEYQLASQTPALAVERGLALLPADRQRSGSVASLSLGENVMLPVLNDYTALGLIRERRLRAACSELLSDFDVRPPRPTFDFDALSGGNQQKALLARCFRMHPKLLLLHEPTQGVDVGARQQITALLRDAARRGTTMICASSDYEQLAAMCDRVLILGRGRVIGELVGQEVTKHRIGESVLNSTVEAAV